MNTPQRPHPAASFGAARRGCLRAGLIGGLVGGLAAAVPALRGAQAAPAAAAAPVKVRVNSPGLSGEGGLFLALDKGYFAAEGLQVELVTAAAANSSTDTLTQIAGGELNVGSFAPSAALFNALNRGIDVVGLLPLNTVSQTDRSTGLIVRQDHLASGRYKTPKDLKGMKIAVLTLGGTSQFNVLRALEQGGLRPGDVDFATLSFPDAVVALSNKSIDAAYEVEPFISSARARGVASLVIPASETSLGAPTIVMYANGAFAKRNRDALQRFVAALLKGQRDYAAAVTKGAGRDELYKSLAAHTAIKDKARLAELALPSVDPNGAWDAAALDAIQTFYVRSKIVAKPIPINRLFDSSYVDAALARIGRAAPA